MSCYSNYFFVWSFKGSNCFSWVWAKRNSMKMSFKNYFTFGLYNRTCVSLHHNLSKMEKGQILIFAYSSSLKIFPFYVIHGPFKPSENFAHRKIRWDVHNVTLDQEPSCNSQWWHQSFTVRACSCVWIRY